MIPRVSPEAGEGRRSEFDTPTDKDTVWTSANVQEVLPDQLSPMSWSLIGDVLNEARLSFMRRAGIRTSNRDPFIGLFYGRPFLNVSMLREAAEQISGSAREVDEQFLGITGETDALARPRPLRERLRLAAILPRVLWVYLTLPREVRRFQEYVETMEAEEEVRPLEQSGLDELVTLMINRRGESKAKAGVHIAVSAAAGSAFARLGHLTRRWLGDETGALRDCLLGGWASVESARPAYDLWNLSRIVLASPRLTEAFAPKEGREIERRLRTLEGVNAEEFGRRLKTFLKRHGHRSVMEGDMSAATWSEDIPSLLVIIRNYLGATASSDPRQIEQRQRQERRLATHRALNRLNWWQRPLFRFSLRQAQKYVSLREHSKSLLIRANDRARRVMRALAERLVQKGLLDDERDVFYLTWEEAISLAEGRLTPEGAAEAVRRRRAEEAKNRDVRLPGTFTGYPTPLASEATAESQGNVLRGLPVAPGRVTGPARLVLDPRIDAAIRPGEILVAPVTDAAWTPLFVMAAGIVVDIGGTLSHGSIVAREFGRPAVVNTRIGTKVIETGQIITVDGSQGLVILEG
ncbi:MAG: PEP-utilizing enzyme [Dehalococcoidia bacterium]|nr:PEP-utilizing enzyme [Dehalococcoidia bacterium]